MSIKVTLTRETWESMVQADLIKAFSLAVAQDKAQVISNVCALAPINACVHACCHLHDLHVKRAVMQMKCQSLLLIVCSNAFAC